MNAQVPSVLVDKNLVVVDVEGNGQNPPEIIEFAALPISGTASDADLRSWLIKPTKPILPMVTKKVHGISNAAVENCPTWLAVAAEIAAVLADRVLVAHGAHVEYRVIGAHLPNWKPPMVLDTMRLAKYVWPGLRSYSLEKLAEHANLDLRAVANQHPHRAAYDTWSAWQLLRALLDDQDLTWPNLIKIASLPESGVPAEPDGGLW